MTSQNAIDYMINSNGELKSKILSSEKLVKALAENQETKGKVLSNQNWKKSLLECENIEIFYENCNYNSEEGTAQASLNSSSAINAFKGGTWGSLPYGTLSADQYIQYNFSSKNTIYRVQLVAEAGASSSQLGATYFDLIIKIKGSNDGENFEDITDEKQITCKTTNFEREEMINIIDINTDKMYSTYRLEFISGGYLGKYLSYNGKVNFGISDIRLYTY